jgi:hypothetical protein
MGAEGRAFTVVVTVSDGILWQPDAFVTRTVKLPDV